MRTTPIPTPLPGPSPRIRSWRVSRASHKAPRPPKPHNLCHEPLLQDTRDLLSFFSFRAHLLGGGRRPPERTRLNSAVRHQLGSRFVLPWGSTDDSGGPGRDHSSIRARWLMRTASLSPHSGCPEPGEAGGPITYSAPLGGTRPFSGTPRVSTPAPELLVIDVFPQHAVQAQHQLARHRHHRYRMGLLPRPQAAEEPSQVFFVLHGTPGGFHQQESQQAVALLGDVAVARGVAAGMLAGVQPAVGGDAASAVEAGDRLERVHHGQRGLQAHAGMGTQPHHARVGGGARGQLLVDGCDLRLQCRQQNLRLLPLGGISAAQGQSREALLPLRGEQPEAQPQLVIEGHGLQAVLHHGAHAHQPVAIAQQRQGVLAGRSGPVHDGKLLAPQQVQQQLGVAPVVLLPAPGELSNRVGIAHQQPVPRLLDQLVEPQGIPRGLDADHCGSGELRVERAHVVAAVVERVLVDLSVGCIHPADGLGADMQVNSDVHCHSRLLFKPKPNGSGREYQLSPRRRVSHDITYKKPGASPLFFSLLPASLLPWLMAGTRLSPMAPAPHASMNDRPSLSYQRRRQQPQPETAPRLSLRNSSARVGILTLLFHGGKIMQLGHIAEGVVDGSGDGCYKISSLSNARRSAPRRGAQFRWGNPSGGSRNLPAYGCMEILSQLGELFLQALPTVIIVFLFYLFLRSNFFQPLERVLAERWARTEGARRAAEASQAAAQEKLRAYQEALKKARAAIYAEQEAARRAVLEERAALIRNARSRAVNEVRAAKEKISADLVAARAEIQLASETLAEEIARVILERRPVAHPSISEVR